MAPVDQPVPLEAPPPPQLPPGLDIPPEPGGPPLVIPPPLPRLPEEAPAFQPLPPDELPPRPPPRADDVGAWLDRMKALYNALVELGVWCGGNIIGAANNAPRLWFGLVDGLAAVTVASEEVRKIATEQALFLAADPRLQSAITGYHSILRNHSPASITDSMALHALKQLLDALTGVALAWSRSLSTGETQSGGASGRVPGIGILSHAVDTTRGVSRSTTAHSALSTIVVAAVPLVDRCILFAEHTNTPSLSTVTAAYVRSYLTEAQVAELYRWSGSDPVALTLEQALAQARPTTTEQIEYSRRHDGGADALDNELLQLGYSNQRYRQLLSDLYDRVPSATEVMYDLRRGTAEPALVAKYGLDDKLPAPLPDLYRRALAAEGITPEVFQRVWRQTWDMGGLSRATEALVRLRPGDVPPAIEFTEDNFRDALAMSDIPPFWVERLRELAFRPVAFRQINQLVQQGGLAHPDVVKLWRNIGYRPEDAEALATAGERQAAAQAAALGHGFTAAEVVKLLVAHEMTDAVADGWLARLRLRPEEIDTLHQRVAAERDAAHRRERIAAIRTAFVHGSIIDSDAIIKLGEMGVVGAEAQFEVDSWELAKQQHAHPLSRAEVVQLLKDGLITGDQYVLRLRLLGYSADDAAASLAIVLAGLRQAQAKAVAAQTKAAQRAATVQQSALARARSAAARAASHLSRLRAAKVNAEEHAAFVQEQAARVQQVKDVIADMPTGPDKMKAENALARATKSDAAAQQEAERQRLLAAEGTP